MKIEIVFTTWRRILMIIKDEWGEYSIPDCNAHVSHEQIADVRAFHTIRNDLDKRHPGVRYDTVQRFMNLGMYL